MSALAAVADTRAAEPSTLEIISLRPIGCSDILSTSDGSSQTLTFRGCVWGGRCLRPQAGQPSVEQVAAAYWGDARVGAEARMTAPGTRACQSKTVQVRQWHSLSAQRRDTLQVASAAIGGRFLWGRELRAQVIAPATLVRASESGAHLHRRCEKGSSSEHDEEQPSCGDRVAIERGFLPPLSGTRGRGSPRGCGLHVSNWGQLGSSCLQAEHGFPGFSLAIATAIDRPHASTHTR